MRLRLFAPLRDEVTLSRKGAKSRRRITGLRSKTTKATDVDRLRAANADLKKKLTEAREQQAATSEILRVISSSHSDLQPVFDTIARSAVDLCGATYGVVFRYDGELLSVVAHYNLDHPSSRSRTRACSTSCANRYSSRPRPPTCS